MQILAVSTSCAVATAALIRDGACVLELAADTDKRHAESILPLIDALLTRCGQTLSDMDLLAVDIGPGSFTGVRIGVSTINAMALAAELPVVPVDALQIVCEAASGTSGPVCALLDARNGNGYAALYEGDKAIRPPDAVVTAEYLASLPGGTALLGDIDAPDCAHTVPTARLAGLAAYRLHIPGVKAAAPLYLRPSQAERMWKLRKEAEQRGV